MQITLPGKVGLVTGGGSGSGRAIALGLAAAGAAVAVVGRRPAPLAAVVAEIQAAGGEALAIPADVSRSSDVAQAVAATASTFGGLDILVNNAGFSPSGRITDITEADWDECLAVNLRSVFLAARAAVPV
ncbi:MAG: SDR family NAD(P)-dependent oxidoreductase, partial [Caldilinea sp.]